MNYNNGKLHGLSIFYNEGKKAVEAFYEKGKLHGKKVVYYPNGLIMSSEFYEHGKKVN
jgi:antitoxin component YwqK of YwqJK toxin-antitoxin module